MKYIQTHQTLEDFNTFKEGILAKKEIIPQRYICRIVETNTFVSFMNTDYMLPKKPTAFEYEKENLATKKFIDAMIKHKMLGADHDYSDKNIYEDEIPYITTIGNLFNGNIDMESMQITKPKIVINDFSCIERLEYLNDISGIANDGSYQNFFAAANMKKIRLPKKLTVIGKSAFAFCLALEDIIIPSSVITIKSKAFFDCVNLRKIEIPASVETLESMVFANSGISKIYLKSLTPPSLMKTTFKGLKTDFIIYVPESAYDTYISEWGHLADHIISY